MHTTGRSGHAALAPSAVATSLRGSCFESGRRALGAVPRGVPAVADGPVRRGLWAGSVERL